MIDSTHQYYQTDEYRAKHAACVKAWRNKNPEASKAIFDRYLATHKQEIKAAQVRYRQKIREQVLQHYGGKCTCCGESSPEFLALDHVDGGGNNHRRQAKVSSGSQFMRWLLNNNMPPGFQVLCHNCNMAKAIYGLCPHQKAIQP